MDQVRLGNNTTVTAEPGSINNRHSKYTTLCGRKIILKYHVTKRNFGHKFITSYFNPPMDLSGFLRHVVVKSYDICKESSAFIIRVAIMVEMDTADTSTIALKHVKSEY
jgi:hypothetical protein